MFFVLKYLLLLAIIPFLLLPTFAEENAVIGNDENTPFVYKDLEGYTIVNGTVYNISEIAINNVIIQVNFYDDFDPSPLEVIQGSTILDVIPKNGQSTFVIRSETPNPNITEVSVSLLGFDSAVPTELLTIITNKPSYNEGESIYITGHIQNPTNSTLNISLNSDIDGYIGNIPNITTNNNSFTTTINTGNNTSITTQGTYTLTAYYGSNISASTTFDYYSTPTQEEDNEYFIPSSEYIILSDRQISKWTNQITQWENAQNRTDHQIELYYDKLDRAITRNQTDKIEQWTIKIGNSMAQSSLYDGLIECLQEQLELFS